MEFKFIIIFFLNKKHLVYLCLNALFVQIYSALLPSFLFSPLFHGSVASHGRRGEVFSRRSLVATLHRLCSAFPFRHPALLFSPALNNSLSPSAPSSSPPASWREKNARLRPDRRILIDSLTEKSTNRRKEVIAVLFWRNQRRGTTHKTTGE